MQVRKSNCENFIFALRREHRKICSALSHQYRREAMLLTGCSERIRSAKILFLQVRKSNCENFIFALRIEHRKTCSALNQQYWRGAGNAADSGNCERTRSAKILFLQLRKSIFRTPES
ncbi:Uncharacterized protein dnm_092210 [Desulfonema magnum]|uniref:Uncharacterized protein n=1 Tax=Desulfonema magnum TaxID=45655 RepID=A0A975BWN4_9BACT|nr:Uncharacterized protein dnm_092210 [Desulfonema magnum]